MADKIGSIHKGTIGWFWPGFSRPKSLKREPERGYIRLGDDDCIELTSLDETNLFKSIPDEVPFPTIITGATEHGGLALLDITGIKSARSFGGSKASVMRYRARTLVAGVDIRKIRSEKLRSISAHFFAISDWLGLNPLTQERTKGADGRLKSFTIKAESIPEQAASISGGREIAISAHWKVGGPDDRRTVSAPVSITCRSRIPKDIAYLRYPLLRIQDLVSFAYNGFISAGSGTAVPDSKDGFQSTPELWDLLLMAPAPGAVKVKKNTLPYFRCSDIGGLSGLKRWVALSSNHSRAIRPVVESYRQGRASAPLRLMEVAAGIEYWVAAHRPRSQWAKSRCQRCRGKCGYAGTLAAHVGRHFTEWVGDPHQWAQEFWSTYNKLKHEPSYSPDEYKVSCFADAGILLLASALFNRVATNKTPSKRIFEDSGHRTWQLRQSIHELLA